MVEKCPQYSTLASPGMHYNACYKHAQSVPLSLSVTPPAPHPAALASSPGIGLMTAANAPRFGTVIPNRIFVGGIDFKTSEEDLQKFFSAFGAVRDTKIIRDRAEVSKGYGFVTFSSTEEVNKVRDQEDCLYLNGKKLNIGQAIRKQQIYFPKDIHVPGPVCSWVIHPGGYASYTNANGITYFLPAPQLLSTQMAVQGQQPYMMAYSGAAAQHISNVGQPIAQYTGFNQSTGAMQPIQSNLALPWTPTHAGSCGQILAPVSAIEPNQSVNLSVIPIASANSFSTASSTPASRTPVPTNANAIQCNKANTMVAAAVQQAHLQMPASYVCSPLPNQQGVPVRFAPHSGTPVLHTLGESSQQVMHSVNFGQQVCSTPTMVSKAHVGIAPGGNAEMAAVALPDGMLPAYGMQQAIYPSAGLVGIPDLSVAQFSHIGNRQTSEVLTPPPTPEIQGQPK